MWEGIRFDNPRSILDCDGPTITNHFYSTLLRPVTGSHPELSTDAARALHHAVAKLRAEGYSFVRWVPFIHLGM